MNLIWSLRSRADLDRIWSFMAEHDIELAAVTIFKIQDGAKLLQSNPRAGEPIAHALRKWSLPAIRYILTYQIDDDVVRIVRVHHARENREAP